NLARPARAGHQFSGFRCVALADSRTISNCQGPGLLLLEPGLECRQISTARFLFWPRWRFGHPALGDYRRSRSATIGRTHWSGLRLPQTKISAYSNRLAPDRPG